MPKNSFSFSFSCVNKVRFGKKELLFDLKGISDDSLGRTLKEPAIFFPYEIGCERKLGGLVRCMLHSNKLLAVIYVPSHSIIKSGK